MLITGKLSYYRQNVLGEGSVKNWETVNVRQTFSWHQNGLVGILQSLCQLKLNRVQEVTVILLYDKNIHQTSLQLLYVCTTWLLFIYFYFFYFFYCYILLLSLSLSFSLVCLVCFMGFMCLCIFFLFLSLTMDHVSEIKTWWWWWWWWRWWYTMWSNSRKFPLENNRII